MELVTVVAEVPSKTRNWLRVVSNSTPAGWPLLMDRMRALRRGARRAVMESMRIMVPASLCPGRAGERGPRHAGPEIGRGGAHARAPQSNVQYGNEAGKKIARFNGCFPPS